MNSSRRQFLQSSVVTGALAATASLTPACVHTSKRSSGLIHVGVIGLGRIAESFEVPMVLAHKDKAKIVAVCDFDTIRLDAMKARIDKTYSDTACKAYGDYKALINDPNVDAVMVCTPDFWHALAAIQAALAGKDIWVQKPLAQTILESRTLANIVKDKKLVMQVGAQQRSWWQFHRVCELVRNNRLGKIQRVEIGLAKDKPGGSLSEMPVPATFNYDGWLGPIGNKAKHFYTETRCHPQGKNGKPDYGRPGWITMEPFGWGMITNWGAHHLDIAQWGLGMTESGPIEIEGTCSQLDPTGKTLWNVHGDYDITYTYEGNIKLHLCSKYKNGIKFIGENGWLFVTRSGGPATKSDPSGASAEASKNVLKDPTSPKNGVAFGVDASDPELLNIVYGPDAIKLHCSPDPDKGECYRHVADWLECIKTRQTPVAGPESSHRSNIVCVTGLAAMKLGRKLKWDNKKELFIGDDEANARFNRFIYEQPGYSITEELKKAVIALPS